MCESVYSSPTSSPTMNVVGPIVRNNCGIEIPHEIKILAPSAATAIKIESLMFEQAMTLETFSSGAFVCMTA